MSARTDQSMLDLFAGQVRARPAATAVSSGEHELSYAELDALGDRVAAWLAGQGAGVQDVVAVELPRGPWLIAALVGILKAGMVYLGLELDTPRGRRDRLVAGAGARAVITGADQPSRDGLATLRLPADRERLPAAARPVQVGPDELAYISYTSGSTGEPKPVGVPHRAVVRLTHGDYAELGPEHAFLSLSPISFDASTFEIWAALLTGGRVVTFPPGPVVAEQLAAVLREHRVTTSFLTTALFHRMVDHHLDAFGGLQQLLTGGEPLSPDHLNRFLSRHPEIRLIAAYGPTENTTYTTCHTVTGPVPTSWVPLGRPIAGTTVRVLDPRGDPVGPGGSGELCTGGAGLARGYLGRPGATAVSFVPDPWGPAGSRMYRTGDLVNIDPGGELEFVGRRDRQVKIRGFRVEPGEVERALLAIPGVAEAVVTAHGDRLAGTQLTAYLVAGPGVEDRDELATLARTGLRDSLPTAMIPSGFVVLERFPLTPHGKVDLTALPVPERTERKADTDYVAPRSATEQLLCDIWAELLGLDAVGAVDDFFELGGNSLLAMDLISRTEQVFAVDLPVRALLYNPTVEEFAGAVDGLRAGGSGASCT